LTPAEQRARQNETVRTTIGNLSNTFDTNVSNQFLFIKAFPFSLIQFGFTNYLRGVYTASGVTLNDDDIVSISELDFLRNASSIIERSSPRIIQNYFVWRFTMNRVTNMPKRYRSVREPFDQTFRGTSAERPRSIICGSFANSNMGFAVSKVYIKQYFDENARNQVVNYFIL
jgi:predicted metalloendopeptidase